MREGEHGRNVAGGESGCGRGSKRSWGTLAGDMTELLGVRARGLVAVARKAELTRLAHGTESQARARGERATTLMDGARETDSERGERPRKTSTDRSTPPGRGREGVGTCGRGRALIGGGTFLV